MDELDSLSTRLILCVRFWLSSVNSFSNRIVKKEKNGPCGSIRIVTKS